MPAGSRIALDAAGSTHFWSSTVRADDGAPSDGRQGSPIFANTRYTPVGCPASGGRVPTFAAGSKPLPVTVIVSPAGSTPLVLLTEIAGVHTGSGAVVTENDSGSSAVPGE